MEKPVQKAVPMRPGRNGGQLRNGSVPGGNRGGAGRPPSAIREKLRGSFEERIKILEAIADDKKSSQADRMRALDLMARYGLGTTSTATDTEGNDIPRAGKLTDEEIQAELKRLAREPD